MKIPALLDVLKKLNPVAGLFEKFPRPDFNFKGFFYDKEFVDTGN